MLTGKLWESSIVPGAQDSADLVRALISEKKRAGPSSPWSKKAAENISDLAVPSSSHPSEDSEELRLGIWRSFSAIRPG